MGANRSGLSEPVGMFVTTSGVKGQRVARLRRRQRLPLAAAWIDLGGAGQPEALAERREHAQTRFRIGGHVLERASSELDVGQTNATRLAGQPAQPADRRALEARVARGGHELAEPQRLGERHPLELKRGRHREGRLPTSSARRSRTTGEPLIDTNTRSRSSRA